MSLCLIVKRPSSDVLPDHVEQRISWDPFAVGRPGGKEGAHDSADVEILLARISGDPAAADRSVSFLLLLLLIRWCE